MPPTALHSPADLGAVADWPAAGPDQDDPLLSRDWFCAATRVVTNGTLQVIQVERGGRPAAIAPLAETGGRSIRRLELIGSSALYEPGGLVARDEPAMTDLCRAIVERRQPIALLRIEPGGTTARAFATETRGRGLLVRVSSPPVLVADLSGGWEAYLAARSPAALADVRRKQRRLQSAGTVRFESHQPDAVTLPRLLEEAIDVEADGWKGRNRSAMRDNEPIRHFVSDLAGRFAAAGELRINFLRVNRSAVAMCIMLQRGGRLWGIKKGYRESARPFSPGLILLYETLRDLCDRGLMGYEFLGSGDRLQPAWATGRRDLQTLVYYPYNMRGALALAADVLGRGRRRRRRRERR